MPWISVWEDEAAVARWPRALQLALRRRPHEPFGSTVFDPPNGTGPQPPYSDQSDELTAEHED